MFKRKFEIISPASRQFIATSGGQAGQIAKHKLALYHSEVCYARIFRQRLTPHFKDTRCALVAPNAKSSQHICLFRIVLNSVEGGWFRIILNSVVQRVSCFVKGRKKRK